MGEGSRQWGRGGRDSGGGEETVGEGGDSGGGEEQTVGWVRYRCKEHHHHKLLLQYLDLLSWCDRA